MTESFYLSQIDGIYVIALFVLIGAEVIKSVPAVLHTPLMSGANAISGNSGESDPSIPLQIDPSHHTA